MEIIIKMIDVENCLICREYIGKGNDPAICDNRSCHDAFYTEVNFNKICKNEKEE